MKIYGRPEVAEMSVSSLKKAIGIKDFVDYDVFERRFRSVNREFRSDRA